MADSQTRDHDVLVVGAGIAGLMAASLLCREGHSVVVVEKDHHVGGRLATRRIGPGRADTGAQFFTVRDEQFAAAVSAWQAEELIYVWARGWNKGSLDTGRMDGHPRYAVAGGMRRLAHHLAAELEPECRVITGQCVTRLSQAGPSHWDAFTEEGTVFRARTVIVTCPPPQALALLSFENNHLAAADLSILQSIQYAPCLCGLFWVDGPVHLPEPGALQMPGATVSWIADNQRKGISPEGRTLTLHAAPEWSEDNFHLDEDTVLERLRVELAPLLSTSTVILDAQLQRWKYALPLHVFPDRLFAPESAPGCLLGGDGFGAPRVEGAFLSGVALAREADRFLDSVR